MIDRAGEHFDSDRRAAHYLRKFHPWYLARFTEIDPATFTRARINEVNAELQRSDSLEEARRCIEAIPAPLAV